MCPVVPDDLSVCIRPFRKPEVGPGMPKTDLGITLGFESGPDSIKEFLA